MRYVLMCGGSQGGFEKHKSLTVVKGEPLVERTIRLLSEAGIDKYTITVSEGNHDFDYLGNVVPMINNYRYEGHNIVSGFWLEAFKNFGEPACYMCTDVYYNDDTIKKIVDYPAKGNILFATFCPDIKPWQEPLAYKVSDVDVFFEGIEKTKQLWLDGKCNRHPIIWELYRVLNGINVNTHKMLKDTYVEILNGGMDIDYPHEVELIEKYYG